MRVIPVRTLLLPDYAPHSIDGVLINQKTNATFEDTVVIGDSKGGIVIFCNSELRPGTGSAPLAYPFTIDWQLLRGIGSLDFPNGCIWEPIPVAVGTTNIANAAGLEREGIMFQVTGVMSDRWLLRSRLTCAAGSSINVSLWAQRCGDCTSGAVPRVDVGNFIG